MYKAFLNQLSVVNYQLVQEVMLPGLRCLKHDMALIAPEHEEVVSSMIKEYESKIETSRPADRFVLLNVLKNTLTYKSY